MLEYLIAFDASLNIKNYQKYTPLTLAAHLGNREVCKERDREAYINHTLY